jgi:hypothetical protein
MPLCFPSISDGRTSGAGGLAWKELDRDASGNTVDGPTALIDTKDSLVSRMRRY